MGSILFTESEPGILSDRCMRLVLLPAPKCCVHCLASSPCCVHMCWSLCGLSQVMAKLSSEAKGLKGAVVSALLSASYAYIQARRVVGGVSLLHALQAPSAVQRVVAAVTAALLAPVYAVAQKLVWSKVRWGQE